MWQEAVKLQLLRSVRLNMVNFRRLGSHFYADKLNGHYRRSVVCHYDASGTVRGVSEAKVPNSIEVPHATANVFPSDRKNDMLGSIQRSDIALSMLTDSYFPSSVVSLTVDSIFHIRVCEMIRAYGKYVDDITVGYFKGVHRWLPIISRAGFQDRLLVFQSPTAADFSILLLSMCLVTHFPMRRFLIDESSHELKEWTKEVFTGHLLWVICKLRKNLACCVEHSC